jgi:hypothetical protein
MATPFPLVNSDLTIYYSVSKDAGAVFASLPVGSNIIQDIISPLYTSIPPVPPDLKISVGSICYTTTLFNVNNSTGYFDTVDSTVLYFKNGTISLNTSILHVKQTTTDDYVFPSNSTNVYEIVSGTGDYLNKKGFIEIITDAANINREVKIYFLKTYSATASASATTIDCNGKTVTFTETASATSTVSAEDAQQIALGAAQDLVNALLSKPC